MTHLVSPGSWRTGRDQLLLAWRRDALAQSWRVASDWFCPEVLDLVRTASRSAPTAGLEPAIRALGRARAAQGVGPAEAVTDLFAFFGVLGLPAPAELVAAFVETWAEFAEGCEPGISCVDPGTGLSTWAHFRARLYELYAEDGAAARIVAMVRLPVGTASVTSLPWNVQAVAGREVLDAFEGSPAVLSHTGATIAALVPRVHGTFSRLQDAANRLDRVFTAESGRGCRLDVEPLPHVADGISRLLDSLRR
ncbi:RsbRD N-terminal domain-containing protein [Sinomonas sp. P47F7]|uniref:RsbRD N-terminal domain-containing protein n=1 Tax=Sinomonas sp. P47F7 TaxID=3410987 RepID=UPI003BF4964B